MIKIISPDPAHNYQAIGMLKASTAKEIQSKVAKANKAKNAWKELGIKKRINLLRKVCDAFEVRKEEIANLITKEIGKPINQSRNELSFFQSYNKWNLENASNVLKDEITHEDKLSKHSIIYEPIGVCAIILPWNSPFGLFSWKVITNLIVGNTVVVKHSEKCVATAKLIEEIINGCDLPEGVFNMVCGNEKVGELLIKQDINLITFTGSSRVGKKIYEIAGKKFIRAILELGGSNAAIVFPDSDLKKVSSRIFSGRFANNGQNCDAIKRVLVHKDITEKLIELLSKELKTKKMGDPKNENTYFGPLVCKEQLQQAKKQLKDALDKGAKIVAQLKVPAANTKGTFFTPTILKNLSKNMKVWNEEVFAPILPLITFETEEEVIRLANDTSYGLGATIFTKNKKLFTKISNNLKNGNVEQNFVSQWIPCNPFGGYKDSGIGRGNGAIGLKELCQVKVISEAKN